MAIYQGGLYQSLHTNKYFLQAQLITYNTTLIIPEGVTSVIFEGIGHGGNSGACNTNNEKSHGGGGGAYAKTTVTLNGLGGQIFSIEINAGNFPTGWDSIVKSGATTILKAARGLSSSAGVLSPSAGAGYGGAAADCVGDVKNSGGNGYTTGSISTLGGGGGAGGENGSGGDGVSVNGDVDGGRAGGVGNGRYSGNGGQSATKPLGARPFYGEDGYSYGGGGGGDWSDGNQTAQSYGAPGVIIVTYNY